jgi:RimJ/RimL family protein N-acetyltransferase
MNLQDASTGFPITQSVLDGTQAGRVFDIGASLFVLHKSGFGSIVNDASCDYGRLFNLIYSDQVPQYFHIYSASPGLLDACKAQEEKINCKIRERVVLRYLQIEALKVTLPNGFRVIPKDAFALELFSSFGLNLENKFWNGNKDFLENAMPVGLLDENEKPVVLCYSAANSNGLSEIDIYTAEKHRNKGLGKVAASLFVNECMLHALTPNWDCFVENTGSINLAISLGFTSVSTYRFLSIFKKNEN